MELILPIILILFILSALLTIIFVLINNSILKSKQLVEEAKSAVDTELKRRFDLIPNLVEAVKGYAGYEKSLLEKITTLRSSSVSEEDMSKRAYESDELTSSIKSIFAIAENYPDLKANQNFLDLQKNLTEVEDTIQYARRYYNGTVREFNIKIVSFPSSLVAKIVNTPKEQFFSVTGNEKENVVVKMTPDLPTSSSTSTSSSSRESTTTKA